MRRSGPETTLRLCPLPGTLGFWGIDVRQMWWPFAMFMVLAGCADPMADLERLSDLDLAQGAAEHAALAKPVAEASAQEADAAAQSEPERRGLWAGLFTRRKAPDDGAMDGLQDDPATVDATVDEGGPIAQEQPIDLPEVAPIAAAERPRTGFLGFLNRKAEEAQDLEPRALTGIEGADLPKDNDPAKLVKLAALGRPPEPEAKRRPKGGLFGITRGLMGAGNGVPEYQQVGPNIVLPYGEIAKLCGVPIAKLGKQVERYPATGRGFLIYDSDPDSTDPRNFYVTGFDDGCARQFTAALVMLGEASMHEMLRYGLPAKVHPYSATDKAYEKIKRRICGVGRNKPCGDKIAEVERTTIFVSVYERFGSNPRWKTILLHDGALVAVDVKESDES
ncbi:MAG: hypothetical protein MK160_10960 [Rhodobacteraceae bacterium]|nr:hypothetical protein [Paracoccaceae bacterium]